jgi:hypothetical protein
LQNGSQVAGLDARRELRRSGTFPTQHGTVEILFPNTALKLEIAFTSGFGVYSVYGKLPGADDGQDVIPPAAFWESPLL